MEGIDRDGQFRKRQRMRRYDDLRRPDFGKII